MEEFAKFKKRFVCLNGIMALAGAVVLFFLGMHQGAQGLILGAAVAALAFLAHGNALAKAFSMPTTRAKFYVFFNFIVRYGLYILVLVGTMQHSMGHFWGAVGGLLLPRLVILLFYTFQSDDGEMEKGSGEEGASSWETEPSSGE